MLTYQTKNLQIYFGDAQDGISKQIHCIPTAKKLVDVEPFKLIAQKIDVPRLSALNQTHGVECAVIKEEDISFNSDGDYLITHHTNVGLGVLTADCVPVILYDAKKQVIAAVHAGWRGAIAGIMPKAFEQMKSLYNSAGQDMKIFIGPSAKICCYQVREDFLGIIPVEFAKDVMIKKEAQWYFDTVQLIALQMKKAGIAPASINTDFNFCTICDQRFFSHRRQNLNAGRQITIVRLY
jgi:YfiH family protein